jgi:hypothetical protein
MNTAKLVKVKGSGQETLLFVFSADAVNAECGVRFENTESVSGHHICHSRGTVTLASARRLWRDGLRDGFVRVSE